MTRPTCDKCGCRARRLVHLFGLVYCRWCWRRHRDHFGRTVVLLGYGRVAITRPEP